MTNHNLNNYLTNRFGSGPYLTSVDLSTNKSLIVTPKSNLTDRFNLATQHTPLIDGAWHNNHVLRGDPAVSLGDFPLASSDILKNKAFIYLAVLKNAGEDDHHIPDQLEVLTPVFQALADYQYAHSPFARSKICAISLRVLPVEPMAPQIGEGWHIHKPYASIRDLSGRMSFYNSAMESIQKMTATCVPLMQTESYFSTQHPTIVQTAPALNDLELEEGKSELKIKGHVNINNVLPHRQMRPYEIVVGSGHTYHTPTTPQDNGNGAYRLFMKHLYIPTRETELEYNASRLKRVAFP